MACASYVVKINGQCVKSGDCKLLKFLRVNNSCNQYNITLLKLYDSLFSLFSPSDLLLELSCQFNFIFSHF